MEGLTQNDGKGSAGGWLPRNAGVVRLWLEDDGEEQATARANARVNANANANADSSLRSEWKDKRTKTITDADDKESKGQGWG
jgi:hypothetical protein